jgi:hypothetical protein
MSVADEMRIGSVDVWELHQYKWPIVRLFARRAVDRLELRRYMRDLLSTKRWDRVRAIPHREADGRNLSIGLRHGSREITDARPLTRSERRWSAAAG